MNPLDIDEIQKAMKYLRDNPVEAKKMGERGREAIKKELSWEKHSKILLESYTKICGGTEKNERL